jgi:hypothetical protein
VIEVDTVIRAGRRRSRPASTARALALIAVLSATLVVPLGLRVLHRFSPSPDAPPSYLPALEAAHVRDVPFDTNVVTDLRSMQPEFVLIGDSMVGSRIDATQLTVLLDYRPVAPIYYAATGSAFWYLALKNWIVGSQIHPKLVVFFFRDENLTDPMFRVTGIYRPNLDRVARDREPALNEILAMHTQGSWYRLHAALDRVYQQDAVRAWLEPRLVALPVSLVARPKSRPRLLERINAEVFGLQALRQMAPADMAQGDEDGAYDFARNQPRSVLPEMFKVANRAGLKLAFVRVQRRPEGNRPPVQSPALQKYVRDLRAYLEAHGALFADDWGDPDQPLSIYADGDHISRDARAQYTEQFLRKHPAFFR